MIISKFYCNNIFFIILKNYIKTLKNHFKICLLPNISNSGIIFFYVKSNNTLHMV